MNNGKIKINEQTNKEQEVVKELKKELKELKSSKLKTIRDIISISVLIVFIVVAYYYWGLASILSCGSRDIYHSEIYPGYEMCYGRCFLIGKEISVFDDVMCVFKSKK